MLVLGVVAATLAFARPAVADTSDERSGIVILAIDQSLSMEATDVRPSRQQAAKEAAKSFLANVPDGVKIGVVGFDGQASSLLAPTDNTSAVERVIDRMDLGEGTAIGEAVYASLDAVESALRRETSTTTAPSTTADGGEPAASIVSCPTARPPSAARTSPRPPRRPRRASRSTPSPSAPTTAASAPPTARRCPFR